VEIPNFQDAFEPEVAWRMVAAPGGGVVVAHQRAQVRTPVVIDHQCSYGGCVDVAREVDMGPIVHSAVSVLVPGEAASQAPILPGVLPVDIAVGPDAVYTQFAVATTGSNEVETGSLVGSVGMPDAYGYAMPEPVAVGFDSAGRLVAQSRLPAQIQVRDGATVLVSIPLGNDPIVHTGHEIFHHPPDGGAALACASCHPEGREDGRPWNFADIGVRRTQSLAGGIRDTAPYHWDGAMGSLAELMGDVFTERMGGPTLAQPRIDALAHWLDTVPLPAPPDGLDPDAVARGREIFDGPTAACSTCHAGERLSNEATIDVGTGGAFQVPSLRGLAARAPYLHTGCAATLAERFDPQCGGTAHGNTADLTAAETADLVAYLETL
jgi:mono/diheme cytochrome c family protein